MEQKGRITGFSFSDGKYLLTIAFDKSEAIKAFLNALKIDTDYRVTIVRWHEKRSLNANAYFHKLCDLIATAKTVSCDPTTALEIKNDMIANYGQPDEINEKPFYFESIIEPSEFNGHVADMHARYVGLTAEGTYRYQVMRGSHTYSAREMAALIEGTIALAKDYNVEVLTPDEIERLLSKWQPKA